MQRAIVLLAVGALAGAIVVVAVKARDTPAGAVSSSSLGTDSFLSSADRAALPPRSSAGDASAPNPQGGHASLRLAVLEAAAALDASALEARIEDVSTEPESLRQRFELEALLARLAELNPRRAMRLAQTLLVNDRLVVVAFVAAAGVSAEDALAELAELARVRRPALQLDIALALINVLGDDERAVERIAAALPAALRPSFEISALVRRARQDAAGAVRAAMRLGNTVFREQALSEIAAAMGSARLDEIAALAALIEEEDALLASSFRSSALAAWARNDAAAALDYLESADTIDRDVMMGLVAAVATADPERLLRLLDRFPAALRLAARAAAVSAVADRDPLQALRLFEAMPAGADRDNVLGAIAQSYARRDPEAAIAWLQSLEQVPLGAIGAIVAGVARVDLDRAVDLVLRELSGQGAGLSQLPTRGFSRASMDSLLVMPLRETQINASDSDRMMRLADGLRDVQAGSALGMTLVLWAQADPARSTDWLLANLTRVAPDSLAAVARTLAVSDLESATRLTDSVPVALRELWVESVASGLAGNSFASAVEWIERFRDQPGYNVAMSRIVLDGAGDDPAGAARLLATLSPAQVRESSNFVAGEWARQDPVAAARWVETISDPTVRVSAVRRVAREWVPQDAAAAKRWARALPNPGLRDSALSVVFTVAAEAGSVDVRLLEEISDRSVRESAAISAINDLVRNDPDAARLLLPYVTNPLSRTQAEARLMQSGRSAPDVGFVN